MQAAIQVGVIFARALQKEENPFEDELSIFAKQTNFDEFECSPYNLSYFSTFYEEMMQRLSEKLKTKAILTDRESKAIELLRAIRNTVLGSWKEHLAAKKEPRSLPDSLRAIFAANWDLQKRIALIPLPIK